jgi:hypothetical protein
MSRPKPLYKHMRACLKRDAADTTTPQNEEIFAWIAQQNTLCDPNQTQPTVVLINGQPSCWGAVGEHIPGEHVTEILDLLHVSGYVCEAAHLLPPGQAQAATFNDARGETLERIAGYFETNRHRMAYDLYLAEGFPIATGVIEGACRCLIKDRMERAGMRWVIAGAQSMLAVRGIALSGLWDNFIAFRIRENLHQLDGQEAANADSHGLLAA